MNDVVIRQLLLEHEEKLFDLLTQQMTSQEDSEADAEPQVAPVEAAASSESE